MVRIRCNTCGLAGYHDLNGGPLEDPHAIVDAAGCTCCPEPHDHTGLGCRTVTIEVMPGTVVLEGALPA
jgi:hypothetical protein